MEDGGVLDTAGTWLAEGRRLALATVVETWGSAPRPVGSHLVIAADGGFAGSVSGGCIEGAVITEALDVIKSGRCRVLEYGVSDAEAWDVGLACGGTIRVFVEPLGAKLDLIETLQSHRRRRCPVAVVTDVESGVQSLLTADGVDGDLSLSADVRSSVLERLARDRSGFDKGLFVRSYGPPWTVIIVGAVHIAQALAPMAKLAGFAVRVIDPRQAFATENRFPDTTIVTDWPDKALAETPPDAHCAVVTLTHDPKLDDPALLAALQTPAFFIGALGSRGNHEKRRNRLIEAGAAPDQVGRIAGPVGLDLGGRSTGEIAVSIVAAIVAARHGKSP
jgi:xanthine dehydrogenase accessory factor